MTAKKTAADTLPPKPALAAPAKAADSKAKATKMPLAEAAAPPPKIKAVVAAKPAPAKTANKAAPKADAKPAPAKAAPKADLKTVPAKTAPAKTGKADKPVAKAAKDKVEPKKTVADELIDIEAEFAAEVEGEAVAEEGVGVGVVEVEAKAKPLRMKVSRAKERALMREFGLDETTLTEEEVAKRRLELKTLIKMGKTRGFLTHQEINDHLPEKLVDHDILEAIVSMLNDMGIAVYEQAPDAATLLIAGGTTTTATEEEA